MQEDIGEYGYLAEWELKQPIKRKKPTKIFVCSTFELFHPCTKSIRDAIFETIESCPQHTFQILTKFPENIDRPMPDNVWLGTTVTKREDLFRLTHLCKVEAKRRFVSFEPLLEFIQWDGFRLEFESLDWIIVGQLTGHGKQYEPKKYWIKRIEYYAKYYFNPLFMKNNLKSIWGENLIQEFPS
jgi:protein gp37